MRNAEHADLFFASFRATAKFYWCMEHRKTFVISHLIMIFTVRWQVSLEFFVFYIKNILMPRSLMKAGLSLPPTFSNY